MTFNEIYPLLDTWVWNNDNKNFSEPVKMKLQGVTVWKTDGKYWLQCILTDKSGARYYVKAEDITTG